MVHTILHYAMYAVPIIILLIALGSSFTFVGGQSVKVVERVLVGKMIGNGRIFAYKSEQGRQARVLGPGTHWLFPFIYKRTRYDLVEIKTDKIGLVETIDGAAVPQGKIFGKVVPCNLFQDGEAFLSNGGEKGPQIAIIPPGKYVINPWLFNVNYGVDQTVVAENQVGLVEAADGEPIPIGSIFGKVVECKKYEDGEAFLKGGGQRGPQLSILNPGTFRINTNLFKITKVPITVIEKGNIGIVTSTDGKPMTEGRLLAKIVKGHQNFTDGEAFLKNGGEKGPQSEILLPGKYRIHTALFKVDIKAATVIPAGSIGLVTAKDGEPMPPTEYVARAVADHDNYQNIEKFIDLKGQRGPQLDVLKPGTFYINPLMFDVESDNVAVVERGQVAVMVSNIGKEPEIINKITEEVAQNEATRDKLEDNAKHFEKRLDIGIERYVVAEGYRGIQQEVVGPGIYYLNRRAYIAYIIDTTNQTIDWDGDEHTKFDPLMVISKDGFEISVSVKVVFRVRPDQAPYMVAKIGSIENLIQHVIHPMIDSSFRNQASSTGAMNFMQNRHDEQNKAEERTRLELERYHVELVSVLICQIILPANLMKTQTDRIIALQEQEMYNEIGRTQESRQVAEKQTAIAEMQRKVVDSQQQVTIAENQKQVTIKNAEAAGESNRLIKEGEAAGTKAIGEAEAYVIKAKGESTATAYELQKKAIGDAGVISIEVAEKLKNAKLVPDTLIGGGGDSLTSILSSYFVNRMISAPNTPGAEPVDEKAPVKK